MIKEYNHKFVNLTCYKTSEDIDLSDLIIKNGKFDTISKSFKSKFINTIEGYPLSITLCFNNSPVHLNTIFSTPQSIDSSYYYFNANTGFPELPEIYPSTDVEVLKITVTIPFVKIEEEPELTDGGFIYRGRKVSQFLKPDTYLYTDEIYESTLQSIYRDLTLNSLLTENNSVGNIK